MHLLIQLCFKLPCLEVYDQKQGIELRKFVKNQRKTYTEENKLHKDYANWILQKDLNNQIPY